MKTSKVWKGANKKATDDLITAPLGRVERSTPSHVASAQTGLLDGSILPYRGSKSNKFADYHSEMNQNVFSDWCNSVVLPAIAARSENAVLVLDRATYHTYIDEEDKRPNTSWNKNRISDSIARWRGPSEDWPLTCRYKKTKAQLLEEARRIYPSPTYKIQKMARKFETSTFKLKVLFLPVAHPELNPIEMVWGVIKRKVAERNVNFNLSEV